MGGNLIVLLDGRQLPAGRELELAVRILGPNYLAAHEVGLLYPGLGAADLEVKIAEPTAATYISACGGMTQVLGKALVEAGLAGRFGLTVQEPTTSIMLRTEAGLTGISIDVHSGKAGRVVTAMDAFMRECYDRGVGAMVLLGIEAMRAGKLLVVNADTVRRHCPGVDFNTWNSEARHILTELQNEFMRQTGEREYNYCLYDWNPQHGGHVRVVFPHCLEQDFIEPSCGTGSIAVGIALLESGEMAQRLGPLKDHVCFKLEAGGGLELGGPDITELSLQLKNGQLCGVSFSHSLVEITSTGQVRMQV